MSEQTTRWYQQLDAEHRAERSAAEHSDAQHVADVDPESTLDDELFGERSRPGLSRGGRLLVAGIVMAVTFTGGVLVQKQHDRGLTGVGQGNGQRAGAFPGGYAGAFAGGNGGGGQFPADLPGGGATPGAGNGSSGSGSSGAAAASPPVVVGQVTAVTGGTITVKNFAGKAVTVRVPQGAKVTISAKGDVSKLGLSVGATVSVSGSTAADGSVTATTVTVTS